MINMLQGFDKGQFGKRMHQFETITDGFLAPPAELGLLWLLAQQETVIVGAHDNIWNKFITLFCLLWGKAGFPVDAWNVQTCKHIHIQKKPTKASQWAYPTTWHSINIIPFPLLLACVIVLLTWITFITFTHTINGESDMITYICINCRERERDVL